jgi:hypothetical protein
MDNEEYAIVSGKSKFNVEESEMTVRLLSDGAFHFLIHAFMRAARSGDLDVSQSYMRSSQGHYTIISVYACSLMLHLKTAVLLNIAMDILKFSKRTMPVI